MISRDVFKGGIFGLVVLLRPFAQMSPAAEWQADWESTLAAAKKENIVTVITDVTSSMRDALTVSFQSKYGLQVDLFGALGREIPPRVLAERKAGRYLWDVFVHGTTTGLESMIPAGAFDPLEPALIFPDIKDPKTWRGGGMEFLDPNKTLMVTTPSQRGQRLYQLVVVERRTDRLRARQRLCERAFGRADRSCGTLAGATARRHQNLYEGRSAGEGQSAAVANRRIW